MKRIRPAWLSVLISFIIFLLQTGIATALSFWFFDDTPWLFVLISSSLTAIAAFFIYYRIIDRFVYARIRIIYKTIRNLKISKKGDLPPRQPAGKMMFAAEREVEEWAENHKIELERQSKLEAYRRDFIGNVSHELKTPIFNIQGYLLTLLDGGLEDDRINREYLLRAEKSVDRMISIVSDLDLIYKIESDTLKMTMEKFDITALTQEVIELSEMSASRSGISLLLNMNPRTPLYVYACRDRIRVVLSNLVENSIKYGHSGGKTRISFFDMDESVLVEVTDNGMGIATDELPRIFERFYRTASGRGKDQTGSGLGLSIVKHIIEAHKQTINVRSTLGVGTTFAFTLSKKP
jgi:two-component system, OmpR family, phosphate regulon sensor histidine kinase PhoR